MTTPCVECNGDGSVVRQHPGTDSAGLQLGYFRAICPRCKGEGRLVALSAVQEIPLRETVASVLIAMDGTGISHDHLAAQIEIQVRAWIALNLS